MKKGILFAVILLFAVSLTAINVSAACSTNADCGSGQTCFISTGAPAQRDMKEIDETCYSSIECASGICISADRPLRAKSCQPCYPNPGNPASCPRNYVCRSEVCMAADGMACSSDSMCQNGFCKRTIWSSTTGTCRPVSEKCTSDADCVGIGKCNLAAGICDIGVCKVVSCSTNAECGTGQSCVATSWTPAQRDMKEIGETCYSPIECASGVCISADRPLRAKSCQPCYPGTGNPASCPTRTDTCVDSVCKAVDARVPNCYSDSQCQSGFCKKRQSVAQGTCRPAEERCSRDADCPAGNKCNIIAHVCEPGVCSGTAGGTGTPEFHLQGQEEVGLMPPGTGSGGGDAGDTSGAPEFILQQEDELMLQAQLSPLQLLIDEINRLIASMKTRLRTLDIELTPAGAENGAPCTSAGQCRSGYCDLTRSVCADVPRRKSAGESCTTNDECETGICQDDICKLRSPPPGGSRGPGR